MILMGIDIYLLQELLIGPTKIMILIGGKKKFMDHMKKIQEYLIYLLLVG